MPILLVKNPGKLLDYLAVHARGYSRSKLKKLLENRHISVNGQINTRYFWEVVPGDKIAITEPSKHPAPLRHPANPTKIKIIYEDDALIVVNKPAGLLSVETDKIKSRTADSQLNELLNRRDPSGKTRAIITHRLDRDVSGILLFAKSEAIRGWLQEHWKKIEKRYYAIVEGVPKRRAGTVKSFLTEDKFRRVYSSRPGPNAKLSVTHYKVIKTERDRALVEVVLDTGRKNQIRVHLADLGHPIVGDEKYGAQTNPFGRIALHAAWMALEHPVTKERKIFRADLPGELRRLMPQD